MDNKIETQGWLDIMRAKYNTAWLAEKFDFSACSLLEVSSYIGIALVVGFALKRYAIIIITAVVAIIVGLWWLNMLSVVAINWSALKVSMGIQAGATCDSIIKDIMTWIPQNKMIAVCTVLGFFIGYKLG